jgi:hemoglobin
MAPLRADIGDNMKYAVLAFALLIVACAGPAPQTYTGKDALYQELGRSEGITKVVDLFFQRLNADARINTLFANVDHDDLRRLVIEQLCAASGGPCTYTGRSMEEAHSGLNLTNKDFDAFVEDLVTAMNQAKVPKATQKKLLAILGPMRPQVVGQ